MKNKFYFLTRDIKNLDNNVMCYTRQMIIDKLRYEGLTEIEVVPAKRETGVDYFWCRELGDVFHKGDGCCGVAVCEYYKPRNGKNGICEHNGWCYRPEEDIEVIRLKGGEDEE